MNGWQRERKSTWKSMAKLAGHMAFTVTAFVTLFTLGWLADLAFDFLNSLHPFRAEVQAFMSKFGLWLTYLDAALCGIVLVGGIIRFALEL